PSSATERRQRPWSKADAYTVCGSSGSSAASLTPKVEPLPFQTSVNVFPPSVDSYSPTEFAPGGNRCVSPGKPITCESPRTPRAEAAEMGVGSVGATRVLPTLRPRKASVPGETHAYVALLTQVSASFVQLLPPSLVLYIPTPASQPELQRLASPVPR